MSHVQRLTWYFRNLNAAHTWLQRSWIENELKFPVIGVYMCVFLNRPNLSLDYLKLDTKQKNSSSKFDQLRNACLNLKPKKEIGL